MDVSEWVALGALVVAIVSLVLSWLNSRKSGQLQRRGVDIEEQRESDRQKAIARADVRIQEGPNQNTLTIINMGPATATNVSVECPACATTKVPSELTPGSTVKLLYSLEFRSAEHAIFRVRWNHPSGLKIA